MDLHVVTRGTGAPVLLVHGSAADHSTWSVQLASLGAHLSMLAYDRRGSGRSPAACGVLTVADHALDASRLVEQRLGGRALVVGSSFGAVVALELARTRPERVAGLVLCEPPLPCADDVAPVPVGFGCHFDRLVSEQGGAAAGDFFLRSVLGEEAVARMPARFRERAAAEWRQIRADCAALGRYRVGYDRLAGEVRAPVALVAGGRSAPFYRDTLESLAAALPGSELHVLAGAGHMMHVEAHRAFAAIVREMQARSLSLRPAGS